MSFPKTRCSQIRRKLADSTADYALKESKRVMNMINSALREFYLDVFLQQDLLILYLIIQARLILS